MDRQLVLFVDGIWISFSALTFSEPNVRWGSNDYRSHFIINLQDAITGFSAETHDRLYLGSPTLGEFSWIPPRAAFRGDYGQGGISFLRISPPSNWPAPDWPVLAAFSSPVFLHSIRVVECLALRDYASLRSEVASVWEALCQLKTSARARRGAVLAEASFREVQHSIQTNLDSIRSVHHLASSIGCSVDGLNRTFLERFGVTAAHYIRASRLRHARRRLTRAFGHAASVAYDAGFSSQSHLSDRFREDLSTSPVAFAKEMFTYRERLARSLPNI